MSGPYESAGEVHLRAWALAGDPVEVATPDDVRVLVDLAGGTRRLAAEVGVSPRTVQRWLRGDIDVSRARSRAAIEASASAGELRARNRARLFGTVGGQVAIGGWYRVSANRYHTTPVTLPIAPRDLAGFRAAIDAGDWDEAMRSLSQVHIENWIEGGQRSDADCEWEAIDEFDIDL